MLLKDIPQLVQYAFAQRRGNSAYFV